MEKSLFNKTPLRLQDGIPVFSSEDRYVKNYQKIASDHVTTIAPGHNNPFIAEELWLTLEQSTRELICRYAKSGARILDVGVGLGRVFGSLNQFERHGIDISFDYLNIARQQGIEVAFSRIEDMPYEDNTFDLISTCDVLEHVLDFHLCTREILRVLKPGGVLVIRVPYKEDLSPYLNPDLPYEFVHLRAFDDASLRLHFGKIFGMEYLESAPVAPYLQGTPRLKIQLLPEAERALIKQQIPVSKSRWGKTNQQWEVLEKAIDASAEEFMNWIYDLRDNYPEGYKKIVDQLVLGMDISAVFRK